MMKSCSQLSGKVIDDLAKGFDSFNSEIVKKELPKIGRARYKFVDEVY